MIFSDDEIQYEQGLKQRMDPERSFGDLDEAAAAADVETFAMQPLFAPGEAESI